MEGSRSRGSQENRDCIGERLARYLALPPEEGGPQPPTDNETARMKRVVGSKGVPYIVLTEQEEVEELSPIIQDPEREIPGEQLLE